MTVLDIFVAEWKRLDPFAGSRKWALIGNAAALLFVVSIVPLALGPAMLDPKVLLFIMAISAFFAAIMAPAGFAAEARLSRSAEGSPSTRVVKVRVMAIALFAWLGGMLQTGVMLVILNLVFGRGGPLVPPASTLAAASAFTFGLGALIAAAGAAFGARLSSLAETRSTVKSLLVLVLLALVDLYFFLPENLRTPISDPKSDLLLWISWGLGAAFLLAAFLSVNRARV
jgi:hypothetical protein